MGKLIVSQRIPAFIVTLAMLIILAMTFGLILPKMGIEHFYPGVAKPIREAPGKAAVPGKFKTRRYRWRFR